MTAIRRGILVTIAALIVATGLYPPFEVQQQPNQSFAAGFGWIFQPPNDVAEVNPRQLIVEWLGLLLTGGLCWLAAARHRPVTSDSFKDVAREAGKQIKQPS